MSDPTDSSRRAPRLAPHVTLTPLPFGGAVLVRASTLSIVECGEQEAALLARLLTDGPPARDAEPGGEAVRRMGAALAAGGWLRPADAHDGDDAHDGRHAPGGGAPHDDARGEPAPVDTTAADSVTPDTHRR
ncbi:actinodefensin-associated protein B [Streptomyces sp. A5-4]|uniref:actinodefensin-associated protein B n=1 Tax=Streptomyces sp. A5-4 TaxID=3384771 RepID=UPI003DA849BC